nr:TonB-dependent receptor plug domain-containing protein [uncultured Allomuricauda sp.]
MPTKKLIFLLVVALAFFAKKAQGQQNDTAMLKVSEGLRNYEKIWTPEKVYAHTDKTQYKQGEIIWVKAYLVDGITHRKSQNSNVLYLELLDDNGFSVSKKKTFVNNFGSSVGFDIPNKTPEGIYKLRCYTKYHLNDLKPFYYEQEVFIGKDDAFHSFGVNGRRESSFSDHEDTEIQISFHPESGKLLYGVNNTIVVKSVKGPGIPVSTSGEIIDGQGRVLTTFQTGKYGLAKCSLRPIKGTTYFAKVKYNSVEKKYDLPQIYEEGYILNVENMGHEIIIKAVTSAPNTLEGTTLVGHLRGERFLWFKGSKGHGTKYIIRIPTQIEEGIAHFTLFDSKGKAVSERLAFIQNSRDNVKLSFIHKKDSIDKKMRFLFELKDKKGVPAKGNLSISVVKNIKNDFKQSIRDWLHFYSDFGDNPLYGKLAYERNYFRKNNNLDALMITGKWKRFSWQDIVPKRSMDEYVQPEKGIVFSGTTKSLGNGGVAVPAMVSLDVLGSDIYQTNKKTDNTGKFSFGPFDFTDSLSIVLKATKLAGKSKSERSKITISLDNKENFVLPEKTRQIEEVLSNNGTDGPPQKKEEKKRYDNGFENYDFELGKDITQLEEVVVTEKKKTREEYITEQIKEITLYNRPSYRVFADSLSQNGIRDVFEIFRTLPGVQVRRDENGNESVRIRYGASSVLLSTEPIYLIDGVQVSLEDMRLLNSLEVMFVDVLKGADAAIYGVRGANGAIAVYTRRGTGWDYSGLDADVKNSGTPNVLAFTQKGFDRTKIFENRSCDIPNVLPNNNETVFWEPEVDILGSRHKELSFCLNDNSIGEYLVRVEGISEEGKVISEEFKLNLGRSD